MDSEPLASDAPLNAATTILCIGMAGSGKSTFMQRLTSDLHARGTPPYVINLDPAVLEESISYPTNLDIRDTVNYKEVMRQYKLGPNGAILTSLNLFTTKFDQVLSCLDKRTEKFTLIDTPGQIEIFTWSASGSIISDTLGANYPTVIAYILDVPRCDKPATFMSNMLYACSIMYKTRLPMIVVLNKVDISPADTLVEWMQDVITFQEAVAESDDYMSSLVQSMSLVLEEFYRTLRVVPLSAFTGEGMDEFWDKLEDAVREYDDEYRPEFERRLAERDTRRETAEQGDNQDKAEQMNRLLRDLKFAEDENDNGRQDNAD